MLERYTKLLFLFKNLFPFDQFSISIRKSENSIKHYYLSINGNESLHVNKVHFKIFPFKNSLFEKTIQTQNLLINYIEKELFCENSFFKKMNLKYALHFPIYKVANLEATLNFLYYSENKILNFHDIHNKITNITPQFVYEYKDLEFEKLLSKLSHFTLKYYFKNKMKNKKLDRFNFAKDKKIPSFLEEKKKNILIEDTSQNKIVFISDSLNSLLKIDLNHTTSLEDLIPHYKKLQFKLYQNSLLNGHYIPLSLKVNNNHIKFFIQIWQPKSNKGNFLRVYEFFVRRNILKKLSHKKAELNFIENLTQETENDIVTPPTSNKSNPEVSNASNIKKEFILDFYQELEEIRSLKEKNIHDIDEWVNQVKFKIEKLFLMENQKKLNNLDLKKLNNGSSIKENTNPFKKSSKNPLSKIKKGDLQNILIIDSDKEYSFLLAQFLHQINYKIHLVHSIEKAYPFFKTEKININLVIIDISIENFKGFLCMDSISKQLNYVIPFIVLSNISHIEILKKSYEIGALSYLNKDAMHLDKLSFFIFEAIRYNKKRKYPHVIDYAYPKKDDDDDDLKKKFESESDFSIFGMQSKKALNLAADKNINLESLGFNLEEINESLSWNSPKKDNLQFTGYFLDKNIFNLSLKGIFDQSYANAIFNFLAEKFKEVNASHTYLIIDLNQSIFYNMQLGFLIKLILRVFKTYKMKRILFITTNENLELKIHLYIQKRILTNSSIHKSIVNALNYLISSQMQ